MTVIVKSKDKPKTFKSLKEAMKWVKKNWMDKVKDKHNITILKSRGCNGQDKDWERGDCIR